MELNEKTMTIIDDDGHEEVVEILFTYENKERNAAYVLYVYPDNPDEVFAARYEDNQLIEITDDEEYDELEEVLETYQNDPKINGEND